MREYSLQYKIALIDEAFELFIAWVLIKLKLKQVTIEERHELKARLAYIQMVFKEVQTK